MPEQTYETNGTSAPDHQDLLRRLMAGAVGVVCDIEGAVHVHLTSDHDPDAATTADVLLEVLAERERQRDARNDEPGEEMWTERLTRYRNRLTNYVDQMAAGDSTAARNELIFLAADVVAHIEMVNDHASRESGS